ncbi:MULTISPECIES: HAD family hydrolase [Cohnella]|uniref:HAD family hydrolase n=1 Tax=Cohnella TaxID=329857 RepID=UPI0009BB939A|nr:MULTISPECIES: HAD family hydrolase [Cohnella]MBN2982763.1 Cof-type HAD-IIB family hydrolase [Cohnella algarum]
MRKNLFFFDFDDTLYSHALKSVPESAREALRELQARGHETVIATGRGPESMEFIRRELALPCETIIFLNGQVIFRNETKIFERFISLPSLNRIMEMAKKHRFAYGGYCAYGEIVDHVNERVAAVWRDFACPLPAVRERFEESYSLYQGHLYVTKEEAEGMREHLADYLMNWSHEYLANLISREAGKSRGIRWILEQTGIPKERSFAFGDGFNDVDMLLSAGHGIAMGNASEELKRAAEFVTYAAHEDGIRHALARYRFI